MKFNLKSFSYFILHRLMFNIKEYNKDKIKDLPCILVPNHVSDLDGPIFWASFDRIAIMAKKECFKNKHIAKFLHDIDIMSVDRDSQSGSELRDAARYLKDAKETNKKYLLFAQGTISDINKNKIERVMPGAFFIAKTTGLPIVPVFIEQAHHPLQKIRIVYGEPFYVNLENNLNEANEVSLETDKALTKEKELAENTATIGERLTKKELEKLRLMAYREVWMKKIFDLQQNAASLEKRPIRVLKLDEKHSNNNDGPTKKLHIPEKKASY